MGIKISELPAAGGANATDDIPANQAGVTRRLTPAHIAALATKTTVGLGNVDNTADANKPVSSSTQAALDLKQDNIAEAFGQLLYFSEGGEVDGFPGLFRNPQGGLDLSATIEPNNEFGGTFASQYAFTINPIQNSPDREYFLNNVQVNMDTVNSGFSLGTNNNRSVTFGSNNLSHLGSSDIGAITFRNNYFNIGNGVDALTLDGFGYALGFGNINAEVTVDGAMQGYTYQPNIDANATLSNNSYAVAFGDFAQIATACPSYTSGNFSPSIAELKNNFGYTGLNVAPTITLGDGNAGVTGINISPQIGTLDTGFFSGVNISPTVTSCVNAAGLIVDMSNVNASGSKNAAQFTGDVSINGDLSFSGALALGQLNAFFQTAPQSAIMGNPTVLHGLITGILAPASSTTADADMIGVNTAMLMTLEDNAVLTSGGFELGLTALALPCIVSMGAGSSVQHVSGTTSAINLTTSTGGTIDHMRITRSVAIPNGVTTVNHSFGYFYHEPFGAVSSDNFSFYGEDAPAFIESGLKIGGTPGTSDRPVNALLHVEGTTQLNGATGFFGATPASQQVGGAATAGGTYGATEQTMLQTVYDALRTYGLLT